MVHLLTFDVEEYFQVQAAAGTVRAEDWPRFGQRLEPVVDRLLELLNRHKTFATFFVLGHVAREQPDLIRKIAAAGHELACHGMTHTMIDRLTPGAFRQELTDNRAILEDLAVRPVLGFRAPTFSIIRKTAWALDVLAELGFRYDSSIFPIHHDRYGIPDAPTSPFLVRGPSGRTLLELPPLTMRTFGVNWPVGGGGYLRLLPVRLVAAALRRADRANQSGMIYLHPWELDPDQPELPLSRLARLRHRIGLKRTETKLTYLLQRFKFSPVRTFLETVNTASFPSFDLSGRS